MMWIGIILIWLVGPFVELGVIIALLIRDDKHKARIRELEKGRGRQGQIAAAAACKSTAGQASEMAEEKEKVNEQAKEKAEKFVQADGEGPVPMYQEQEAQWLEAKSEAESVKRLPSNPVTVGTGRKLPLHGHHNMGMLTLIIGVVFIVLAGLIFATTTWHILPDICKVFGVLGCAVLFFGASFFAEKRFKVHKTSNAFYVLGSIFLFLTILAAAYFKLLGAEFLLEGRNRWKVLWAGSVVTVFAFWAGLKRFDDKVYTQACLWGISISLFFMAQAFSFGWDGFAAVMMIYSAIIVSVREYLNQHSFEKKGLRRILSDGFGLFAPIHFWVFAVLTALRGLSAIWIMAGACAIGYNGPFHGKVWFFSFTAFGMASMAALMIGTYVLTRRKQTKNYGELFSVAVLETILYTAGWITEISAYRMAVINLAFLLIQIARYHKRRETQLPGLFWDICGGGSLLFSIVAITIAGNDKWRFAYLLMAAFYCLQYRKVESVKKQALSFSACFVAAAFWLQPFGLWPQEIRLEMGLLPVAWLLWTTGLIWDTVPWVSSLQNFGYMLCLVLLFVDAVVSGLVVDSLLLEGICLGVFVRAQIKERVWWVRISGGMSLAAALFMTRGFWLSISWWVYLLAAGIGLVVLAGFMEKKEKERSGR